MMLSFACSSLSRHGELIFKGVDPQLRRWVGQKSLLEETALSCVTSCPQLRDAGEEARRLSADTGDFRVQMVEAWRCRRREEDKAVAGRSTPGDEALP